MVDGYRYIWHMSKIENDQEIVAVSNFYISCRWIRSSVVFDLCVECRLAAHALPDANARARARSHTQFTITIFAISVTFVVLLWAIDGIWLTPCYTIHPSIHLWMWKSMILISRCSSCKNCCNRCTESWLIFFIFKCRAVHTQTHTECGACTMRCARNTTTIYEPGIESRVKFCVM